MRIKYRWVRMCSVSCSDIAKLAFGLARPRQLASSRAASGPQSMISSKYCDAYYIHDEHISVHLASHASSEAMRMAGHARNLVVYTSTELWLCELAAHAVWRIFFASNQRLRGTHSYVRCFVPHIGGLVYLRETYTCLARPVCQISP